MLVSCCKVYSTLDIGVSIIETYSHLLRAWSTELHYVSIQYGHAVQVLLTVQYTWTHIM